MNRFIRFYNRNRGMFWIIVVVIVGIIVLVQTLNNYYKNNKDKSSGIYNTTTYNTIKTPVISGTEIEEQTSNSIVEVIDNFINYCNNKQIEQAYSLLSNDCKENVFPNINTFVNSYYNRIFTEYRLYNATAWINNGNSYTYRVEITEDILSTGASANFNIEDYYTIVKENNEYKLNIKNYIGKEQLMSTKNIDNITFNVIERYIYTDYEIYKIKIENKTANTIKIDGKENTRSVNVVDQNGLKYVAFLNEISDQDLILMPGTTKEIRIKFNKSYNPNYKDEYMEFKDIILNLNSNQKSEIRIEL